jgi:hypothetical protein
MNNMNEIPIKSFTDFHNVILKYNSNKDIYRGDRKASRDLNPKIFRIQPRSGNTPEEELRCWRSRSVTAFNLTLVSEYIA